ncbi:MAG: hypothetical protein JJT82_01890 [Legionellaceae bacterium]|nr:hypothetical protein [Legionellaceae bacterium]
MKKIILHPTEISQWHALLNEAQAATQIILQENTESYLVFLLMRFNQGAHLIESIIALDYLGATHRPHKQQLHQLQEVGDKSLLFCGLFPGMATKRRVNLDYYVNMGQSAYLTISEHHAQESAHLYYQLGQQFKALSSVLNAMRYEVRSLGHYRQ